MCKEFRGSDQKELPIIIRLFVDAYSSNSTKGLIGRLYNGISSLNGHTTRYIKERWEKELDIEITEDTWTNAWITQSSTTNSLVWRDFCWKNLIRFFITPKQKSKQTNTQLRCWRDCRETGVDHAHVFWLCPLIQNFWMEVAATIAEVLGFNVETTFTSLYLGCLPEELCKDDEYLLKILLAAGKKAITKYWLQKDVPTLKVFIDIVNYLHLLEQMTYSLRLQKEIGEKRWGKWSINMAQQRSYCKISSNVC